MSVLLIKRVPDGNNQRCVDIERVVRALEGLDYDKSWKISVQEVKSERSLAQNSYLWAAYAEISKATGYEKADLHDDVCKRHFGTKLKRGPRGNIEVPLRTTTTDMHGLRSVLNKSEFMDLVEFVKRYAAEAGVYIADPDEYTRNEV